jgi:hypothetical protein
VAREEQGLSVTVGPLVDGSSADTALRRVLDRLVDWVEPARRNGQEWLTLWLSLDGGGRPNQS